MTGFVQMAYGLLVATNLTITPDGWHVASNRPYFDPASQVELYEGVTERRAATMDRIPFMPSVHPVTVVNPSYVSGYVYDPCRAYTNTAHGTFYMLSFSKWDTVVGSGFGNVFEYYLNAGDPIYPYIRRSASFQVFYQARGILGYHVPYFVRSYSATSATAWTEESLWKHVNAVTNAAYVGSVPPILTVSNLTCFYNAVTNLTLTEAGHPTWNGGRLFITNGVTYYSGSTGTWTVAELATGVVSTLDVSMICTQSIDTSTVPATVSAESIDLSFVADPVDHFGPSINRLPSGTVSAPEHPTKFYRVEMPRDAIHKWRFTRCKP